MVRLTTRLAITPFKSRMIFTPIRQPNEFSLYNQQTIYPLLFGMRDAKMEGVSEVL